MVVPIISLILSKLKRSFFGKNNLVLGLDEHLVLTEQQKHL
jgi:hypothetical protein